MSVGYRTLARVAHELRVLAEHARGIARLRLLPLRLAPGELRLRHVRLDQALLRVDGDRIAFLEERDGPALVGFGRDVSHHHAPRAAGEAPVGDEPHGLAEALADERRAGRE